MCGVCGIFDFRGEPIDYELLKQMNHVLRHRGPDGEGFFVNGQVGIANRRLSIIDLEAGWQPQTNEDNSIQVVLNGEIYNYIELREELLQHGHNFKTRSDTEVLVHAYEEWGDDCVARLNGIFAFAIWDSKRCRMLLARDHLGVKPLYYLNLSHRLLFASEIKALLTDPACPREVDLEALSLLFTLRYVPSPRTLFQGIHKLLPGHRMVVKPSGLCIERYWTKKTEVRTRFKESELIEEYQTLLEDAVRLQMRSDVPVGLFLSSGIDSGSLLAMASRLSSSRMSTFTIGFEDGEATNETDDARRLAERFGSDHHQMVVTASDYQKYYDRYLEDIEEPVGNETAAAFYFVSRIASEKVKVALTGQGADEPWAGYGRHLGVKISQLYSRLPQFLSKGILGRVGEQAVKNERMKRALASLHEKDVLSRLVSIYSFFTPTMKASLFKPWIKEHISSNGVEAKRALRYFQVDVETLDPVTQMLYMDTRTNLPDDLLMVGDKTSMANSLEARVPFLDYRIVEFIESLPPNLKLRRFQAKYLHKKALEKWLPKDVIYRRKKGFANPIHAWLRVRMRKFVSDCLLAKNSGVNQYFNQTYVRELIRDHEAQRGNYLRHIYLLLSFELWHRKFISSN